ncbi:sensor histidine kinase [Psychrobacillus antarcticus]|uniref:sensor histidine kinase n=1 Tax=Psychrobacillus antarcticus TaxID=2879115 RepID=UPI00240820F6|nr:histidine kinase N-terminal 7TM domain-containing protein [Psychrobacillus antarcticus]
MTYNLYLVGMLIVASGCSLFLAYLCWNRRELPIAISCGLGMLTGAIYTFGYSFEILSTTMEEIYFWLRIEYIAIPFGTVFWFIMVLQYVGYQAKIRKVFVVLLFIIPALIFVSFYTNEWHYLFYRSMSITKEQGYSLVHTVKGPLYMVHVIYAYLLVSIGMFLLIRLYRKVSTNMKKQVALMIIGSFGPFGFALLHLIGLFSIPFDLSPFGFIFSGIFFVLGIFQYNMMKLYPLALKKVFESMQDAVIVFDLDNNITRFNQSASKVITKLNIRAIGQNASKIFSPYPELLERIMEEQSIENKQQISEITKDQYYQVQMVFIKDNEKRTIGKMLLLSNVSAAVQTEKKLQNNAKQLSELNQFKDKMFNVVAHDIRDPLAVLVNLMELMDEEIHGNYETRKEIVQEMNNQLKNTFTLVDGLLDWFRSQKEGIQYNPKVWDLSQIVQSNVSLVQVRSEVKRIQIESSIQQNTYILADKEMLDLVIRNLLSNAIKFTDFGGNIHINAVSEISKIIVSVRDTGDGISPNQAEKLFEETYPTSLDGTAGERGVGLGLSLCKEFVHLNGGEIWFESVPTKGSTFYFTLPIPTVDSSNILRNDRREE